MVRIALLLQYIGSKFAGWQRQPHQRTVQEELEKVLSDLQQRPVRVIGAGRTDSGVHAAAQVAHFDALGPVPPENWANILNARLPDDIRVRGSAAVPPDWHARFSANSRRYRYTIYNANDPNIFIQPFCWHYYHNPLDTRLMHEALQPLLGEQDLMAFCRANSERKHSLVRMQDAQCYRDGDFVYVELQAQGFLYGMVRLLVGLLIYVGNGDKTVLEFTRLWQDKCRDQVKYAAPARGLCLLRVGYPVFPFPQHLWFDTQPKFLLTR